VTSRRLDSSQIMHIFAEKKQIIRKSGLLEYIDISGDLNQVGGLDMLKDWLRKRTIALSDRPASSACLPRAASCFWASRVAARA